MAQQHAFGTTLEIDNGGSYSEVAYVRSVDGPNMSLETVDSTHHGSTSGFRTYVAGLADAGEVSAEILFDPSNATHMNSTGLLSELVGRTSEGFKITWPDATTATFTAFVTAFSPSSPYEGMLTADVTLKLTGTVTFA